MDPGLPWPEPCDTGVGVAPQCRGSQKPPALFSSLNTPKPLPALVLSARGQAHGEHQEGQPGLSPSRRWTLKGPAGPDKEVEAHPFCCPVQYNSEPRHDTGQRQRRTLRGGGGRQRGDWRKNTVTTHRRSHRPNSSGAEGDPCVA